MLARSCFGAREYLFFGIPGFGLRGSCLFIAARASLVSADGPLSMPTNQRRKEAGRGWQDRCGKLLLEKNVTAEPGGWVEDPLRGQA